MSKKKVLVIDDNEEILELLKEYLLELDTEPVVTSSAADGLRLAETEKPDLILLDIMMPEIPGDEVAAAIKINPKTSDIPIVFLTGLASAEDEGKSAFGDYQILPKDLPPAELLKRIRGLIE